jgi:N-acetylmuramoyl-L-alanine amidase
VDIHLEHPAEVQTSLKAGMPSRLTVRLDRSYLKGIMTGRVVLVDPGHGGNDPGASGPTKVLEKNTMLDVGRRLAAAVRAMGGEAVLTRDEDRDVTRGMRFRPAHEGRVDCLVSLHLGAPGTENIRGARTLYLPSHPDSPVLAGRIQEALVQKLKLNDRGVARDGKYFGDLPVPAVAAELVSLHNPVDEALLRSWIFRERLAQCLSRGLKNFFLTRDGRKDGRRANGSHRADGGHHENDFLKGAGR